MYLIIFLLYKLWIFENVLFFFLNHIENVAVSHCVSDSHSAPFLLSCWQNSGIEKAFLFDVVSKIYIATDSSPVDMQSYELCCDMIDVVIDVSCIYG